MSGTSLHKASAEQVSREFERLFALTAERLERNIARVAVGLGSVVCLLVFTSMLRGMRVAGPILVLPAFFTLLYGAVLVALRTGLYRPWMRYVLTTIDMSMGSLVLLVDHAAQGPLFALTAVGPALYSAAAAITVLRLNARLCVYAGTLGALQYLAIVRGVLQPALAPELATAVALESYVTLVHAIFILSVGIFGAFAAHTARTLMYRFTTSVVERERVRGLFGMHVSEAVVEHLLAGGVKEGGERRQVTILFSDIRNFTSLSETRAPEEVLRLLNRYFSRMCAIVAEHDGVVNKFLGDGMLVVFGAPTDLAHDAQRALACARQMVAEAERMSREGEFPGLRIGVGLHRGEAVAGNVGGVQRQEYTLIGDTVNTASRVQDLTKPLQRSLLVTKSVLDALPGEECEPLGAHQVKGREQPLELFAPQLPSSVQAA